jgi:hypothetical protein
MRIYRWTWHPHFVSTYVKVKGKDSLCFSWAPHHEGILGRGRWRYSSTHSLTSALDGSEWSASRPRPLYSHEKSPWYPLDRRLGGSRAVLDAVVKRKISSPRRESNHRTPIVHPVAQLHIYVLAELQGEKLMLVPGHSVALFLQGAAVIPLRCVVPDLTAAKNSLELIQ